MIQVHKITKGVYLFESAEYINKIIFAENKIWMSQKEISKLFQVEPETIHQMISKIFLESEYEIFDHIVTQYDTYSQKGIKYYSLDVILSLGYRLKSFEKTKFLITGNRIIKHHLHMKKSKLSLFQNSVKNVSKLFKSLQLS